MTNCSIHLLGDWRIEVLLDGRTACFDVAPPPVVAVVDEPCGLLPLFNADAAGWVKGYRLAGVRTQETSAKGMLAPGSLRVRPAEGTVLLRAGEDYLVDEDWGTVGRCAGGGISEGEEVLASYRHGLSRIDAVVLAGGRLEIRRGEPHITVPRPPEVEAGAVRLANLWLPGRLERLGADNLFPVTETTYPEPPKPEPAPAATLLPNTYRKLRAGEPVKILAWGDSVTDAGYLPDPSERWQEQLVNRLNERFPAARIELVTEAWGGRNTGSYLAEPPGAEHNYAEKVLAARPDLVISEFVNDGWMSPEQVDEQYGRILADFRGIGAEWIILTPHYILPEWMGTTAQREIDDDPRPYVQGLRRFAARHGVALADASRRWGRLWRQGIPYMTLLVNAINHPDVRGMRLFADSVLELF